ncbi:MAG TPA: acetyl-CoA carboxylase biotin carboxylase subunit, partial [Candidatus Limnocylindrales bacterium]
GPGSATIEALGDKLAARRLAASVGVLSVPGTLEPLPVERPDEVDRILDVAAGIGFPIMVKAAAGGGGRGMRRVDRPEDLPAALAAGSAEAASAFGDGSVYLERVIEPARHVEVQLLGDAEGNVVALGERDCSIQRRHQKLIEEAPAPGLGPDARRELHEMAVTLASAAGLRNAATCEFLFDGERFFFLEVNTRLQVEHGVTELVSGLDIVREQLWLAAGRPLSDEAHAAATRAADPFGHAIEARIAAEDPGRGFTPTPGTVGAWLLPAGPGIRVDTALEAGDRVAPEYDNLIAKLMVHAGSRDAAIDRLARALDELVVTGIQTTVPFDRFVCSEPDFRAGRLSTGYVEEHWDGAARRTNAERVAQLAAGLDAIDRPIGPASAGGPMPSPKAPRRDAGWRRAGLVEGLEGWPR